MAASYDSPLVAGSHVFIAEEDGEVVVFKHSRTQKLISEIVMDDTIEDSPKVTNNALYITTRSRLYAIEAEK